jgi:hypothetical protein
MKRTLLIFSFLLLTAGSSFSQDNTAYKTALGKMMQASGAETIYKAAISQMMTMMKQQKSEVPAEVWENLQTEMSKISVTELTDMLVPVYQKHLTIQDINALTSFYNTPIGKKFAEKSPLIMQESMQVGQQWGQKIGQQVADKLKDKGY